jgi:hypothetical protein
MPSGLQTISLEEKGWTNELKEKGKKKERSRKKGRKEVGKEGEKK